MGITIKDILAPSQQIPKDCCRVEVDEVKAKTEKAWLCLFDGKEIWLPLSLVSLGLEPDAGLLCVDLPYWLAKKHLLV